MNQCRGSLLRRRFFGSSRIPPQRMSAETSGTFLSFCSQRSAGDHVEMTKEPIALAHKLPWGDNFPGVNSCMKSDQKRFKICE